MGKLVCKECGYKFKSKLGYQPRKCPYCSKESIAEDCEREKPVSGF